MSIINDVDGRADIRSERTLSEFTVSVDGAMLLAVRVGLGGPSYPIAGGSSYNFRIYVNTHLVVPDSTVTIASGVTKVVASSKTFIVRDGDTVRVSASGAGSDADVSFSVVAFRTVQYDDLMAGVDALLSAYADDIVNRVDQLRTINVLAPLPREVVDIPQDLRS